VERARAILRQARGLPSAEVLDAVVEDWRRHQGQGPPADDTTLVLIRRAAAVTRAA
jgi:serine phosphatase RsbU (regulator of sigma subunit)